VITMRGSRLSAFDTNGPLSPATNDTSAACRVSKFGRIERMRPICLHRPETFPRKRLMANLWKTAQKAVEILWKA